MRCKVHFLLLCCTVSDRPQRHHGTNLRKRSKLTEKRRKWSCPLFCKIHWTAACQWQDNLGYIVTQYFNHNEVEMNKHKCGGGKALQDLKCCSIPFFSCSGIIELSHMLDYQCIYLKVQKNSLLSVIISKIFEWASDFYCLGFHT